MKNYSIPYHSTFFICLILRIYDNKRYLGPPFRLAIWCEGGASLIAKLLSNLYFLLALLLLLYGYNCFYMVYASFKYKPRKPVGLENHPVVTVQLPIFNERYVISRLMNAVCSIEWPRGRLQIQILDDSSDDTSAMIDDLVEKFRSDGHEIQTLRQETREGFKAGALKNALKHTSRNTSPSSTPISCRPPTSCKPRSL